MGYSHMQAAVQAVSGNHLLGWARDPGAQGPAIVQIFAAGTLLAEAPAQWFRPELLQAGIGHGHYGFRARLRPPAPSGEIEITLHLPRAGESLVARIALPHRPPASAASVESLIETPPGWTVQHVRAAPDCLDLAANLAAMGAPRFVDMVFHFALRRWPAPHEAQFYGRLIEAREISPNELLLELLDGRERAELDAALASPWDPEFPFLAI